MATVAGIALLIVVVLVCVIGAGARRIGRWAMTGEWSTPEQRQMRERTAAYRAAHPPKPAPLWPEYSEQQWREDAEYNFINYWADGGPDRDKRRGFFG